VTRVLVKTCVPVFTSDGLRRAPVMGR